MKRFNLLEALSWRKRIGESEEEGRIDMELLQSGLTAHNVAAVLIDRAHPDEVKLQKLLYYVQAITLAIYTKAAFPSNLKAYKFGPVVPEVWHAYKDNGDSPITDPRPGTRPADLSAHMSQIIDMAIDGLAKIDGFEAAERIKSIHGNAWSAARKDLPLDAPSEEVLDPEVIRRTHLTHGLLLEELAPDYGSAEFDALRRGDDGAIESLFA